MLMRLLLWAILLGSVIMGYFGYKTGSATNAAVGMALFLGAGFILFFLLKALLHFGLLVVKIFLFLGLIALIVVAGLKGCEYMTKGDIPSPDSEQKEQTEITQSFTDSKPGLFQKAMDFLSFKKKKSQPRNVLPNIPQESVKPATLPKSIQGKVTEVRSGYLFKIGKHYVKLYGIDTPDPGQSCLDRRGSTYKCGKKSRKMLERLILGHTLACQIAGGDYKGNYIATCKTRGVDVGASLLAAGWAVADRATTSVYTPYEDVAHRQKRGLWAGKFVAPWAARAKHVRQQQVKKEASKGGFWESLFK
ncbi:MAG: thermonuclease family protein [Alphaproteobacteria bacterium]|nr:thermonuclease family protein [Alphaproteobacteria bacterium]